MTKEEFEKAIRPNRFMDKAYWIEYAESLEIKLAGKDAVIEELKKDVAFYKRYQTEKYEAQRKWMQTKVLDSD